MRAAVQSLVGHYERLGDIVLRLLGQEKRFPAIREVTDEGRRIHYQWVERAFAPFLADLKGAERRRRRAQLIALTDVYMWKLLRRDLGLGRRQTQAAMAETVSALLEGDLMGKYLAYTSPARGHLYPIVDTLIELRGRGHEVAVRTLASEVPRMQQLGFSAAPIAPAIEAIEPDDWQARTPIGANTRLLKTFARRAEHEIGDIQAAIDEVEPDAVLVDINCQGAATVAEARSLPWAMWTPYFMPLPSPDAPPFGLGIQPRSDLVGRIRDALCQRSSWGRPNARRPGA